MSALVDAVLGEYRYVELLGGILYRIDRQIDIEPVLIVDIDICT